MIHYTEERATVLKQKLTKYKEFLSVTELLRKAFENEEMTSVNDLITRREDMMRDIERLDYRLNHDIPLALIDQSTVAVQQTVKISEELVTKLKQIISANKMCTIIAANNCNAARIELMNINQKKEGLQGYGLKMQQMPKFLNVQT